jgi:hypothetical protein
MLLIRFNQAMSLKFWSRIPEWKTWYTRKATSLLPWLKTSAIISAEMWIGDACCQKIETYQKIENSQEIENDKFSFQRSNIMALTGFTTSGPLVHWLVHTLERISPGSMPAAILTKVLLNCGFMPIMFGTTLAATSVLNGQGITGACRKVSVGSLRVLGITIARFSIAHARLSSRLRETFLSS